MKIALTGAHGTGKSTLAKFLQGEINKLGKTAIVTPEVPRMICEMVEDKEYFRRGNNSLLKQCLILIGQLVVEGTPQLNFDIQICDRTLLDHWAYSLNLFGLEINDGNYTEIYENFIFQHCRSYDKIFYLPIEFKPLDDGIREGDENFQEEIDKLIVDLLRKRKQPYEIVTGTVEDRSKKILETIKF